MEALNSMNKYTVDVSCTILDTPLKKLEIDHDIAVDDTIIY